MCTSMRSQVARMGSGSLHGGRHGNVPNVSETTTVKPDSHRATRGVRFSRSGCAATLEIVTWFGRYRATQFQPRCQIQEIQQTACRTFPPVSACGVPPWREQVPPKPPLRLLERVVKLLILKISRLYASPPNRYRQLAYDAARAWRRLRKEPLPAVDEARTQPKKVPDFDYRRRGDEAWDRIDCWLWQTNCYLALPTIPR